MRGYSTGYLQGGSIPPYHFHHTTLTSSYNPPHVVFQHAIGVLLGAENFPKGCDIEASKVSKAENSPSRAGIWRYQRHTTCSMGLTPICTNPIPGDGQVVVQRNGCQLHQPGDHRSHQQAPVVLDHPAPYQGCNHQQRQANKGGSAPRELAKQSWPRHPPAYQGCYRVPKR
jgi:hypothetical protein